MTTLLHYTIRNYTTELPYRSKLLQILAFYKKDHPHTDQIARIITQSDRLGHKDTTFYIATCTTQAA